MIGNNGCLKAEREEDYKQAKRIAFKFLSRRARSSKEVEDKLIQKGFAPAVVKQTVSFLAEYGYLNHPVSARALAVSLFEHKHFGFARIATTLRTRGVPSELVGETLSHLKEHYSEEKTALQIMQRRFSHFDANKASPQEKQRLVQFFRRRGFSWETILQLVMK